MRRAKVKKSFFKDTTCWLAIISVAISLSGGNSNWDDDKFAVGNSPILDVSSAVNCILVGNNNNKTCQDYLEMVVGESDEFYYNTGLAFTFGNIKAANISAVKRVLGAAFSKATGSSKSPGIYVTFLVTNPQENFAEITNFFTGMVDVVRNLSGIILDWKVAKPNCNPSSSSSSATTNLAHLRNLLGGTPIGIAYTKRVDIEHSSGGTPQECLPPQEYLLQARFIQVNVIFNLSNFIFSYEPFKEKLVELAVKIEGYVAGTTGAKPVFYNLRFSPASTQPQVYSLFTQFGRSWARDTMSQRKVVLDAGHFSTPELFRDAMRSKINSRKVFRENVILTFDADSIVVEGKVNGTCWLPCKLPLREMLLLLESNFNSVLLSYDTLICTLQCWGQDNHLKSNHSTLHGLFTGPERRIFVTSSSSSSSPTAADNLSTLTKALEVLGPTIKPVFLIPTSSSFIIAKRKNNGFVSFACQVDFDDNTEALSSASNILKFARKNTCRGDDVDNLSVFVWKFKFEVIGKGDKEIRRLLQDLHQARTDFLSGFASRKDVVIWASTPWLRYGAYPGVYCSEFTLRVNGGTEAIANWAAIRGLRVIMSDAFDLESPTAHWSVPKVQNLTLNPATFLPLMRNYPGTMWGSQSAPCIEPPMKLQKESPRPKNPVVFNEGSGVSLDLSVKRGGSEVPEEELITTLMQYTFHKFCFAEILLQPERVDVQLKTVEQSLRRISKAGITDYSRPKVIYLELPLPQPTESKSDVASSTLLLQNGLRAMGKLKGDKGIVTTSAGIHFSRWNHHHHHHVPGGDPESTILDSLVSAGKEANVSIGLTLEDCVGELNRILKKDSASSLLLLAPKLSYIVCQESAVVASNRDKGQMSSYLDGHLVVKTAFQRLFPNLTVHFRLTSVSPKTAEREVSKNEQFIHFIGDVFDFSSKFNVSYFLCRTLDQEGANGWWRLLPNKNNTDLNLNNYYDFVEKEAEYLEKPSWRATPLSTKMQNLGSRNRHVIAWAGLALGALALVTLPVAVWLWKRKSPPITLSEAEVKDFFEGSVHPESEYYSTAGGNTAAAPAGEDIYTMMKFNEKHCLAKEDFEIDFRSILGTGNFGMVYKAKVKDVEVAVKVQHSGCSKDTFKSMLNEVKILSWVGSHPNVLAFVGCYTQEIKKGVIYIATERCANGNLMTHLRTKYSSSSSTHNYKNLEPAKVQELIRFGSEIASGMDYISSRKVVHGDLSSRNVLLDGRNSCKIGDFGLSRKMYEYGEYIKSNHQEPLPWRWMALESLKFMEFTSKSDVWAYGVTVWEIFSLGEVPYGGRAWSVDFRDEIESGMRLTKPQLANENLYEIMMRCWDLDPERRPSFLEMWAFCQKLSKENLQSLLQRGANKIT